MFINQHEKDAWDQEKGPFSSSWNTYVGLAIREKSVLSFKNLGNGACHGKLSANTHYVPTTVEEIYSKRMPLQEGATEELANIYYSWLLNESPWAPAFIEKDYKVCEKTGFRIRTDLPADFVASACVATRFMTEKYQSWTVDRYPLYKKLLDQKVDPLWAFIMSNIYYPKTDQTYSVSMVSGHEMLPPSLSMDGLKRFVRGEYAKNPLFNKSGGYRTIGTTWGAVEPESMQIKHLSKNWPSTISKKTDLNIFRRPDPNSGYPVLSFKELLQVMEYLQEKVYVEKVAA